MIAAMWIAWFSWRFPRRDSRCTLVATGADLDGCGAVVGGEVVAVREPADVAGLTDGDRGADRTEAEHLGHRRAGRLDRVGDALLRGAHLLVDAAQVLEMLERQRRGGSLPPDWPASRSPAAPRRD